MSTRAASRKISTSIATLAAQDELGSDDEMVLDPDANMDVDITLVDGEEEEGSEEEEDDDEEEEVDDDEDREEEEELEDQEEEEDEEVVVVPQKRKQKRPPPREIEYKIAIYTAEQMKKTQSSRGPPNTQVVNVYSNEPWKRLKSHILTKINSVLKPDNLNFFDFTITFKVPRQVSDPMHLADDEHYKYLVKKALLIQKNPSAKIIVEPKETSAMTDKENNDEETKKGKKGSKKTRVPNARDILPANVALNEKIGELRERWICPTPGGSCGSAHCDFSPTEPEHFPLSHTHMQSWAAAWYADLETPPNNEHFDRVAAAAWAAKSPLLQRRLEQKEAASAKHAPAAPQVHINFPPEIANLLRPAPPIAAPNAFIPRPNSSNMLISPSRVSGADLSIEDFCSLYDLDSDISHRFKEHKFKRTTAFKFVEVEELKEMGFMKGEIAELKVAVETWSKAAIAD
ncbi:hypothetical protein MVEN_00084900 [Mycena venus]|uniref:Uncharacterized protein n=1 Tax=Mycena venus TaxID=2733690 RepID=A0A8H6Z773_9AGAR|nr:hypothetical protein MVEN_00084900 [Mycena venus]